MFHYSFKSRDALIQHIVVLNNTITFYQNKSEEADFPEIHFLKEKFNLKNIQPYSPIHVLLHNPLPEELTRNLPHQHFSFEGDPKEVFENIISTLEYYQKNPTLRETSYDDFCTQIDKLRIAAGDKVLPVYVQNMVDNFDLRRAFMPEEEIEDLRTCFDKYQTQQPSSLFNKIFNYILELLTNRLYNTKLLPYYDGKSILEENYDSLSIEDKYLRSYYEKLETYKNQLIHYFIEKSDDLGAIEKIENEINELQAQPIIDGLNSYIHRVESSKKNHEIDFSAGFWFFPASRATNREANYFLALELRKRLCLGEKLSDVFTDVPGQRANIIHTRKINENPDYVERGLNSGELNKIINMAMEVIGNELLSAYANASHSASASI